MIRLGALSRPKRGVTGAAKSSFLLDTDQRVALTRRQIDDLGLQPLDVTVHIRVVGAAVMSRCPTRCRNPRIVALWPHALTAAVAFGQKDDTGGVVDLCQSPAPRWRGASSILV